MNRVAAAILVLGLIASLSEAKPNFLAKQVADVKPSTVPTQHSPEQGKLGDALGYCIEELRLYYDARSSFFPGLADSLLGERSSVPCPLSLDACFLIDCLYDFQDDGKPEEDGSHEGKPEEDGSHEGKPEEDGSHEAPPEGEPAKKRDDDSNSGESSGDSSEEEAAQKRHDSQENGNQGGGSQGGGSQGWDSQENGNQGGGNQEGGNQEGGNQEGGNQEGGNQEGEGSGDVKEARKIMMNLKARIMKALAKKRAMAKALNKKHLA